MDDKLFRELLTKYTNWQEVEIEGSAVYYPPDPDSDGEPITELDTNTTIEIQSVKSQATCEDCGDTCRNRRTVEYKYLPEHKLWRPKCNACDCLLNPYTNRYELDVSKGTGAWIKFAAGKSSRVFEGTKRSKNKKLFRR
jgi:hypothetical protein